ncbi:MAG: VWA domain-containing protein, partial [Motiliproteus sp.]|nr:VWA domain-containing protein [Motiliproteus sp.]
MNTISRQIRTKALGFLTTFMICTPVWADDTEIYFGGSTNVTVQPNVLFVLDTSGSMTSTDGGSTTRLDRMKTALTSILNTSEDINVGLMRFTNPGGPILYPVTDIDQTITTTVVQDAIDGTTSSSINDGDDDAEQGGDTSVTLGSSALDMTTVASSVSGSVSVRINSGSDDSEERSNGSIYLNSSDLELMQGDGYVQTIGLRFSSVNVPQNAVITNAWIEFEVDEQNGASANDVTVLISGQDADNPPTFSTATNDISGRTKTSANTTWAITSNPSVDSTFSSPTINAVVQEIVDRSDWAANDPMVLILDHVTGSGIRWMEAYEGESASAAQLHINYVTGTPTTITVQVSDSFDDAEEDVSSGSISRTSSDLELMSDGGDTQIVGLRFSSLAIPDGATIADARLEFEIDEENSASSDPVTIRIYGEDTDSAASYGNSKWDISSRTKTSNSATWAITENPAVNNALISPNVSTVLQEIVDRSGWSENDPVAFVIEHISGTGIRWVESENGEASAAAQLHVTYMTSSTTPSNQTIGLRFNNINIPQGSTISSAVASFTADADSSDTTSLTIYGHDTDQSSQFSTTADNLGSISRPRTTASVSWSSSGGLTAWVDGSTYDSPDLTSIIQEIVNRSGWCGGNSLSLILTGSAGLRIAKSYENDPSQAPQLDITYDPASNPSGCMNHEFGVRVSSSSDDAEESSSGTMDLDSSDLELVTESSTQKIGIRFNNVQLNQGATISSAFLEFAVDETDPTTATSLTIKGEDVGNSTTFTTSASNISGRTTTTASETWSISDQWTVEHDLQRSPDISSVVNEILARSDWAAGNSMTFIITGSGKRVVESYDGSNLAPRLVYYANPTTVPTSSNTVRSKLIEIVNNLDHKSGTPIVDSLYEAARYYRGEQIDYGKTRGSGSDSAKAATRVSHSDSYTGGALVQPSGCSDDNLGSSACADEEITGSPTYISPISESCQSNHIVLLTDGYASVNTSADKVKTMTGDTSCVDTDDSACGPEITYFLKNSDQLASMSQDQNITTHTIGFNFSDDWLRNLATQGGGGFHEAESATELTSAFDTIIKTIKAVNTTFVEPSVTINQFNRFAHRDDVYFALFKPQETAKWYGNLKKYQLKGNPATLYDNHTPQEVAIDSSTGFFAIDSKSFWSN